MKFKTTEACLFVELFAPERNICFKNFSLPNKMPSKDLQLKYISGEENLCGYSDKPNSKFLQLRLFFKKLRNTDN